MGNNRLETGTGNKTDGQKGMGTSAGSERVNSAKTHPLLEFTTRYPEAPGAPLGSSPRQLTHKCGGKNGTRSERLIAKYRLCGTDKVSPPSHKVRAKTPPASETVALVASRLAIEAYDPQRAVDQAMELLWAADSATQAASQEHDLLLAVFELDEAEWETRLKEYQGDLRILAERFECTYIQVTFTLNQLFRSRTETEATRRQQFLGLVQYAYDQGLRLYSKTGESLEISRHTAQLWLDYEELDILTIRWLVVARQRQIAQVKAKCARKRV